MKKDKAIETLNDFPQEFELEELIERLIFIDKVEKGISQIYEGKTKTHSEVKEKIEKWSK